MMLNLQHIAPFTLAAGCYVCHETNTASVQIFYSEYTRLNLSGPTTFSEKNGALKTKDLVWCM